MSISAERNLLLAALALRLDLVPRDNILQAMQTWSLDRGRSLADILQDQGALPAEGRANLESLVETHLSRPHEATSVPPAQQASSRIPAGKTQGDRTPDELSRQSNPGSEPTVRQPAAHNRPATAAPTTDAGAERFRLLRRHASGGLGDVYLALDRELKREVALKQIQTSHAENSLSQSRFLVEAEITGRLEHPGIVPVYSLGRDANGRPYYAMRFIHGQSLRDAIADFHDRKAGLPRGERTLLLRQLLARFIAVCQTMQYAHDRGILHRDLKPSNIMLGQYGETLVVDWGLAKPFRRDLDAGPPLNGCDLPFLAVTPIDTEQTLPGAPVGTPAYMSPEQAAGNAEQVGPASDVYSLGATLYCLLTGRAPIEGTIIADMLRQVRAGEYPPPRELDRTLPAPLESICLRAMALDPTDRYGCPRELAGDLEHWLADEPVSAHAETWTTVALRWVGRHRTQMTGLAAAVFVGLVSLAIATVLLSRANKDLAEANLRVQAEKEVAEEARTLADDNAEQASKNAEEAQRNAKAALANEEKARSAALLAAKSEEQARASAKIAAEQRTLALESLKTVVFDIQSMLKDRSGLHELRKKVLEKAAEGLERVERTSVGNEELDHAAFASHVELGDLFEILGDTQKVLQHYRRAHEIAELNGIKAPNGYQAQRDRAIAFSRLGSVHLKLGDSAAARNYYQKSRDVSEEIAAAYPEDRKAQRDLFVACVQLGEVHQRAGEFEAARELFDKGLRISLGLACAQPQNQQVHRDVFVSYINLGDVLVRLDRRQEAAEQYLMGLWFCEAIAQEESAGVQAERDLALAYHKLGTLRLQQGELLPARDYLLKSLKINETLSANDGGSALAQRFLAVAWTDLGDLSVAEGNLAEAQEAYLKDLRITEKLTAADPSNSEVQRDLFISFNRLGDVALQRGEMKRAREYYEKGLAITSPRAAMDPASDQAQWDCVISHAKLGLLARAEFQSAEALSWFEKAHELYQGSRHPQSGRLKMLADSLRDQHAIQKAERDLSFALEKTDDTGTLLYHRVGFLARKGRIEEAIDTLKDWAKRNPDHAEAIFRIAQGYGLCLLALENGDARGKGDTPALRKTCTEQAFSFLHIASKSGYFDNPLQRTRLEHAPALRLLRDRPEFKELR